MPAKHVECSIRSVVWHGPVVTPDTPQTRARPARRLRRRRWPPRRHRGRAERRRVAGPGRSP